MNMYECSQVAYYLVMEAFQCITQPNTNMSLGPSSVTYSKNASDLRFVYTSVP